MSRLRTAISFVLLLGLVTLVVRQALRDMAAAGKVDLVERVPPDGRFFPRAAPEEAGINREALENLLTQAEAQRTDALIVLRNGQLIAERYFGKRGTIELHSVTKSIVSLAIGILIDEGKIASLDSRLSTWFPEWDKDERKAKVNLRHVLTHTSGLEHHPAAGVLASKPDQLAYARRIAIVTEPGATFSYNNEACQLLSGVIESAAGMPADRFVSARIFEPMGITRWSWQLDAAGNVLTYTGLRMTARDLARIGQMIVDGGVWNGQRIVSQRYLDKALGRATPANDDIGLLFWLHHTGHFYELTEENLATLEKAGLPAPLLAKLRPVLGKRLVLPSHFFMEAGAVLTSDERAQLAALFDPHHGKLTPDKAVAVRYGRQVGARADGWLGQKMLVYHEDKMVVVRLRRQTAAGDMTENREYGFLDLRAWVDKLIRR
jgi:CubicO group peptidase (beta-lactamase class C family)